jgi:uncharacterized protein
VKVVIDTNILLVSISPRSAYRWVFDAFLNESYILCVTTDILMEYEEILSREMGSELASVILQIIEEAVNVEFITKYFQWNLIEADPDDNKFADCAIAGNAKFLVTQDRHFNILKTIDFPKVEVINVETFSKELTKLNP